MVPNAVEFHMVKQKQLVWILPSMLNKFTLVFLFWIKSRQ